MVLDAYALVAWLAGEPCAPEVRPMIQAGASISSVNLAEVVDRMARIYDSDVALDVEALSTLHLEVVPLDMPLAIRAGGLRAQHYDRRSATVSMADCIAVATALDLELPVATADPALARMMRAEGGEVVGLPDSAGRRPGE
jgi:ribonuclease VapC